MSERPECLGVTGFFFGHKYEMYKHVDLHHNLMSVPVCVRCGLPAGDGDIEKLRGKGQHEDREGGQG